VTRATHARCGRSAIEIPATAAPAGRGPSYLGGGATQSSSPSSNIESSRDVLHRAIDRGGIPGHPGPIVTALLFSGIKIYFLVLLPIFGLVRGVMAIGGGSVAGGVFGMLLNIIAGLLTLTVAWLIGS
jgi:hypothetical protein